MHILLTDVLTCPRCGPRFGLVLLADEMAGREVVAGRLGCPNCREEYPIRAGVADLRLDREDEPATVPPAAPRGAGWVERLAALLGVTRGPASLLVLGAAARDVDALADLLPFATVVPARRAGGPGEGALVVGDALPLRDRALRGVALVDGEAPPEMLADAARLLVPGARLVVDPAVAGTAGEVARLGLNLLLDQEGAVVASAP